MPTSDREAHISHFAHKVVNAAAGCTCKSHVRAVRKIIDEELAEPLGRNREILEKRSKALNRVGEQCSIYRSALLRAIEAADVHLDAIDPTKIHDAIGHEIIGEIMGGRISAIPQGAPVICGCSTNVAGDICCHKCGQRVNKRCWNCGTVRGEGACPNPIRRPGRLTVTEEALEHSRRDVKELQRQLEERSELLEDAQREREREREEAVKLRRELASLKASFSDAVEELRRSRADQERRYSVAEMRESLLHQQLRVARAALRQMREAVNE